MCGDRGGLSMVGTGASLNVAVAGSLVLYKLAGMS
jgi:tRNA G18 (ribose-2'-O)-methylase SpoU